MNPAKLCRIQDYCRPGFDIRQVGHHPQTGQVDLDALAAELSGETAAVYFENPSFLGQIETQGDTISRLAHEQGAVCVVSANPMSLGVLNPPATYGADIVCGDIQPLGMHMQYGGGHAGYIASHDREEIVMEYPSRLFGIAPTSVPGEYGFGDVAYDRTSFAHREQGKEWVGTAAALWGITAGVYLALMGPQGMAEIGEGIMARARYAMLRLDEIEGVRAPLFEAPHFQEFVVRYDVGKPVKEIHQALQAQDIYGGKDLSQELPDLGDCALYCISEVHTQADIDRLVGAVKEIVQR